MNRLEVLNRIAGCLNARTYLEVGVQEGKVLRFVAVPHKVGVDPDPTSAATLHRTSDDYFADLDPDVRFDLIFIDGLHLAEQVEKDVENALRHLTPGGVIVLHDCDPPTERSAQREINPSLWCGDVWKAWVKIRARFPQSFTVDTDLGLGVIPPHSQPVEPTVRLPETWQALQAQRVTALGLVSEDHFRRWVRTLQPLR